MPEHLNKWLGIQVYNTNPYYQSPTSAFIQFKSIFSPGQMEGNGCIQRLDLAEISMMSMLKLKNYVKIAKLFAQTRSTCLPRPGFFQDMSLCWRIHVMRRIRRVA